MTDKRIRISDDDFGKLVSLQQSSNYTQFYMKQYEAGSSISGLYLSGPTGQGVFGSYSHNYSTDLISETEWLQRQTEVSEGISQSIIKDIQASYVRDGYYSLPTPQQVIDVEISAWKALGLPANSYAGYDLTDFLAFDNNDPTMGQTWIGAVGDLLESIADINQKYYVHNGEILSYDDVVASGDFVVVGAFVFTTGAVELDTVSGVFTYQGQRYHSGQLETVDGIHFIDHPKFGRIPVGITTGKAAQLLASINDIEVPEASIEAFLAVLTLGVIEPDEWAEILNRGRFADCFGPEASISMWPLDAEFAPDPDNPFKQYDQDVVRAKIWKKPIELIRVGDYVVSHDKNDNMVPGYVPRTMNNQAKVLLNFHGTPVTPGHVYYRPDSKRSYKYETLIDVLRDDGMIEHSDVVKLRAATNVPVGDPRDGFVLAVIGTRRSDGGIDIKEQGRIRLGTRFLVGEGKERKSFAVADLIEHGGGVVGDDELIRVDDGEPMPFLWEFGDTLPKPEDFVLACSSTTLEDIYKAAEWESHRPHMPPPMVMDGGPVQPLSHRARSAMARNEPLSFESATSNPTEL